MTTKKMKILSYVSAIVTFICGIIAARYSGAVLQFSEVLIKEGIEPVPELIAPIMPTDLIVKGGLVFLGALIMLVIGIFSLIMNIKNKTKQGRVLGIIASSLAIASPLLMLIPVFGTTYLVVVMLLFIISGYLR